MRQRRQHWQRQRGRPAIPTAPQPWTLYAYHTDTAPPASRHLFAGRGSSFTFERTSFTPHPPTPHPLLTRPQHESTAQNCTPCPGDFLEVWVCMRRPRRRAQPGCSPRRLPPVSNATCLRLPLPAVPDCSTKLLLHIPSHRTVSRP